MRKNRVVEQNRCYHLVSRLAHRAFFLDDEEKDRAVALMRRVEAGVQASMSYCINRAIKSIVLVNGYCDDVTLDILSNKRGGANVTIATVAKTPITQTAVEKFNKQNPTLTVKTVGMFHDRFLIIDNKELYHFGASLKNLGRQYCAVTKMDAMFIPSILQRVG
jgi:hypothetical protein